MIRGKDNDFLVKLLTLQQDGKAAISAPTNWTKEPLLEVETKEDLIINELEDAILVGARGNSTARWHFFIGSPGNGKSAAMGKLCRRLTTAKGCQIQDEDGTKLTELADTAIPYALNVYEGSNRYVTAQIVQDASVVRNPFSSDVDPAAELMDTMKEAWTRGISLVVCTNRGVLEKAHRDNHTNKNVNTEPWFKILDAVISKKGPLFTFGGRKTVFSEVKIDQSRLDNRSLLREQNTFDRLIQQAIGTEHWQACNACIYKNFCPFKANREWLIDDEKRMHVLRLLERAEVLSGQVIVFREALAIISLVLAGCPRDYDHRHPCEWVREAVQSQDIFSLASRRIYMCLFASHSPHGLEAVSVLHKRQMDALRELYIKINAADEKSRVAMKHVVIPPTRPPSTDVGVTRLLGPSGILAILDPCRESLPTDFYDKWDCDFITLGSNEETQFTLIEQECVKIWKQLEDFLELTSEHAVSAAHWALQRWSSNFLLHFGALVEGRSAWSKELDAFGGLLTLVDIPRETQTAQQKISIQQLNTKVEILLNTVAGGIAENTIQLSEAVTLSGEWVRYKLKPKIVANDESGSVSLAIEFKGGERAVIGASMYLWLARRADGNLDTRCFPQELLAGAIDARVRAAAKGRYAFEDNDIELVVDTGKGERFKLTRIDGEVIVNHD